MFAQLVSKIFNLYDHDPPTLQTDRQTTCDLKTSLCTIVHRAVIIANITGKRGILRKETFIQESVKCMCRQNKVQLNDTILTIVSVSDSIKYRLR